MNASGQHLVVQRPAAVAPSAARELLLLFHGVGSSAEDLRPLGLTLAAHRLGAWIVSVQAPERSEFGAGWQWFPVHGVTEANRPHRVVAAMPAFLQAVAAWQQASGIGRDATTLIGFSQGAIMALESTQHAEPPAARVVSIAGRFAQPPRRAPARTALHLMHGEKDPVMPSRLAAEAVAQWRALGAEATLDLFPGLAHGIDARVVDALALRLASPFASAAA